VDVTSEQQLVRLQERIDRLEQLVVRSFASLSAVLLVLGVLLDYVSPDQGGVPAGDENDPDVALWGSLLGLPFRVIGFRDGVRQGEDTFLGICFVILLLVVASALVVLRVMAMGNATARVSRAADVVGVLLVLGTLGALPFALSARSEDQEGDMGPALAVLAAGVLVYLLLLTPRLRRLWDPTRGAPTGGLRR
jgi:hypothetical protein